MPFLLLVVAGQRDPHDDDQGARRSRAARRSTRSPRRSGPSFPSGHSSWSAAFFAAAALLLAAAAAAARGRCSPALRPGSPSRWPASRVLLDVHWLSDVIAGLALGWAWFAVCAIAFGGRLLRFGAAAEEASRVATAADTGAAHPQAS